MDIVFLARATVGTSLYVSLSQLVSQLVSQLISAFLCVRSLGYIVGASPPPVKICVSVRWVTLWVRPPSCDFKDCARPELTQP